MADRSTRVKRLGLIAESREGDERSGDLRAGTSRRYTRIARAMVITDALAVEVAIILTRTR